MASDDLFSLFNNSSFPDPGSPSSSPETAAGPSVSSPLSQDLSHNSFLDSSDSKENLPSKETSPSSEPDQDLPKQEDLPKQNQDSLSDSSPDSPSQLAKAADSEATAPTALSTDNLPASEENISQVNVSTEMRNSFLEYAYSVIYARALPDARDGLKPVQRRILYMMDQMGLDPKRGHVKSSRVVGEVMGKLHPHGDSAIYEALVRLAQDFSLRLPLIDGHGNFGSLDDGPAAARYTEARMSAPTLDMVNNLKEDVVDFIPNYDNQFMQPEVLPAGFPNLLVNGASGIAVGMATNIPPHNLGETISGAIHLLYNPEASLEELMRFIPGPDLPGGGEIVGLEGIREAYETGRGIFKTRAKVKIERISARKQGLIVTELPYMVGPERVIEKIKEGVNKGRIKGISAVTNLTDRKHSLRLVVEIKNGFNPQAVLASLFKHTPMEDSFGINAVALVAGQPRTMGLKELLQVFLDHRLEIVQRRSKFRLDKCQDRLHLVEGLLIAVLDIDDVIVIIRSSDDAQQAKLRLMEAFELDEIQAEHILSLQLRRLTKFSRIELEREAAELKAEIDYLTELLNSWEMRRDLVAEELREVLARHNNPRRTILREDDGNAGIAVDKNMPLEIPDDPCVVALSARGLIARFSTDTPLPTSGDRQPGDALRSSVITTARAHIGAVLSSGELVKLSVLDTPQLPLSSGSPSLNGGSSVNRLLGLAETEEVIALVTLREDDPVWWMVTAQGVVKRGRVEILSTSDRFEIISLNPGDYLVAAGQSLRNKHLTLSSQESTIAGLSELSLSSGLADSEAKTDLFVPVSQGEEETFNEADSAGNLSASNPISDLDPDSIAPADLVILSDNGQVLRTSADKIRPQGRSAGGMAGMKLAEGAKVIAANLVPYSLADNYLVVSIAGYSEAGDKTRQSSIKASPVSCYPLKGRAGMGVRCHRFLKQETKLVKGAIVPLPGRANSSDGGVVILPQVDLRRDASGTALTQEITYLG